MIGQWNYDKMFYHGMKCNVMPKAEVKKFCRNWRSSVSKVHNKNKNPWTVLRPQMSHLGTGSLVWISKQWGPTNCPGKSRYAPPFRGINRKLPGAGSASWDPQAHRCYGHSAGYRRITVLRIPNLFLLFQSLVNSSYRRSKSKETLENSVKSQNVFSSFKTAKMKLLPGMTHTHNPSTLRGRGRITASWNPACAT